MESIEFESAEERNDFWRYELIDKLYSAQNNLRRVWIDGLPKSKEGFGQIDVVPWALKNEYVEEFKVNGRTSILLTTKGRDYIRARHKILARILEEIGL